MNDNFSDLVGGAESTAGAVGSFVLPRQPADQPFQQFVQYLDLVSEIGERVYFFCKWPDGVDPSALPSTLHRKKLWFTDRRGVRQPRTILPGAISTTRGSPRIAATYRKLQDFNALGYEIFRCQSRLRFPDHCGWSVVSSRHAVLESDSGMSPEEQLRWFAAHRGHVRFAVATGNKSVHGYVALPEVIANPQVARSFDQLRGEKAFSAPATHERFRVVTSRIERWAVANGLVGLDHKVLTDPTQLVRVPPFRHHRGGMARLYTAKMLEEVGTKEHLCCVVAPLPPPEPSSLPLPESISESLPSKTETIDTTTANYPATLLRQRPAGAKPVVGYGQWLVDLRQWEWLTKQGIPAVSHRIRMHYALFTVARLKGWSVERMADEWRAIIMLNPGHIRCSVEEAVADMLRHWRRIARSPRFILPRLQDLTVSDMRAATLRDRLSKMGCPDAYSAARIIHEVLVPVARANPLCCADGMAAIEAARFDAVSRHHNAKQARRWLEAEGILRPTCQSYQVGRYFKRYAVSIHQILWLLDFQPSDLQWQWEMDVRVPPADRAEPLGPMDGTEAEDFDREFFDLPAPVAGAAAGADRVECAEGVG
jgi:hypothetical protein